jgi:hypothetical protein
METIWNGLETRTQKVKSREKERDVRKESNSTRFLYGSGNCLPLNACYDFTTKARSIKDPEVLLFTSASEETAKIGSSAVCIAFREIASD